MIKEDIVKQIELIEKDKDEIKQDFKALIKEKNKEQRKLKKVLRLLEKE